MEQPRGLPGGAQPVALHLLAAAGDPARQQAGAGHRRQRRQAGKDGGPPLSLVADDLGPAPRGIGSQGRGGGRAYAVEDEQQHRMLGGERLHHRSEHVLDAGQRGTQRGADSLPLSHLGGCLVHGLAPRLNAGKDRTQGLPQRSVVRVNDG